MKSSSICLGSLSLAALLLLESCASSTVIQSNPSGAKLYLNNIPVGVTPYTHTDTKIVGTTTSVRLEQDGYEPLSTSFSRDEQADVGAIIGGVFVLVPFLWTMKYNANHLYELRPYSGDGRVNNQQMQMPLTNDGVLTQSKADRLRDLKKLLDDGTLTKEEFDKEKKKILESDN